MPNRPTVRTRSPVLLALGLCLFSTAGASAQAPPRLAGRWALNLELSDQIEEKLQEALRPGSYWNRATAGATKQRVDDRELMGSLTPAVLLVIRQDDSTVSLSDGGGFMVPIPTNGRTLKEYLLSGETLEVSARWKDGVLTIERKQERAGSVRETYALDQGKLIVTHKLRTVSLPRPLESRRVYDPAPEG